MTACTCQSQGWPNCCRIQVLLLQLLLLLLLQPLLTLVLLRRRGAGQANLQWGKCSGAPWSVSLHSMVGDFLLASCRMVMHSRYVAHCAAAWGQ